MIVTRSLTYHYKNGPSFDFPDMECAAREQLLILGQSGVGKSTLLHLLGGLMSPNAGSIEIGGQDITKLSGRSMDQFRGSNIGVIFQQNHFIAALTVLDNLLLAQSLSGVTESKSRCLALLDRLNIGTKANKNTNSLSQGERQRVAIARALLRDTPILLLDEATSALDAQSEAIVQTALDALSEGRTTLVIAHRLSTIRGADQIVVMDQGQVVETGTHADLIKKKGAYAALHALQADSAS